MSPKYTTVRLRSELTERVRKVVDAGIGYRSIADFVAEATRRYLAEIEPLLEKLAGSKAPSRPPAGGGCGAEGADSGGMSPGARGGKEGG